MKPKTPEPEEEKVEEETKPVQKPPAPAYSMFVKGATEVSGTTLV